MRENTDQKKFRIWTLSTHRRNAAHFSNSVKTSYKCLHSQFEIDLKYWYSARFSFKKGLIWVVAESLFYRRKT